MADYYEILEVSKNATKDEIKSAFRKKARVLHPDVNKAPDAEEKFKELGKAYEVLMDDEKRQMYDRYGEDGLKNSGYDSQGPFASGFGDLSEIFNSFFGGGFGGFSRQRDPNAPQQGQDLRVNVELTFEEAVFGTTKEIKVDHLETCKECNGTGAKKGSQPVKCPTCNGTGQVQQSVRTPLGSFTQIGTCPDCHGKGVKITDPCPKCKGTGMETKEKKLELKIPAGVDTGSKMRLSGEGDAGKNGGPAGDLYVVLYVQDSDYFKRDGYNVYTTLELTPAQAVMGDEITIKTLDGERTINVPAGTQSHDTLKLRGAGISVVGRNSQRGDHVVIFDVIIPNCKKLPEEERQLYRKLYELNTGKKLKEGFIDKIKNAL
ncbi:molecular chaperone DnaJ [bacterium]|nr:molecular chaperone DnaJ [bacterium]